MGEEDTHIGTHQDTEFSLLKNPRQMLATIRQKNQEHFSWGLKSVEMRSWLPELLPHIRNPVFLFCSRSLAESMESDSPYSLGSDVDLVAHLSEEAFWCNFFLTNAVPWCVLKYKSDPEELLDEILDFTGIFPTDEQVEKALVFNNPEKGYQTI
jgi:hypothetical protein